MAVIQLITSHPETGKKIEQIVQGLRKRAYQYVKDFEFREDLRNDKAKKRLTFLSEDQLRDAEIALRRSTKQHHT